MRYFCVAGKGILVFLFTCLTFGVLFYLYSSSISPVKQNKEMETHINTNYFRGPPEFANISISTPHEELARIYHAYVDKPQIECHNVTRYGNVGDGGWFVCRDRGYELKTPCLVYSFGINNDWSFDDAVASSAGCQVYSFDPSMKLQEHMRGPLIHFYPIGLDGSDGKNLNHPYWKMNTLNAIRRNLGHLRTSIDVLKVDIEGSEWNAFPEMVLSGALDNVKQFCFEIHYFLPTPIRDPEPWQYHNGLLLLKDLYNLGFRIFKSHGNPWCTYVSRFARKRISCHEVYMINTFYTRNKSTLVY